MTARINLPARAWLAPPLSLLLGVSSAHADGAPAPAPWPDTFLSRVEVLALLQSLNADLLSHDSATLTLERWCSAHHLAAAPRIVAERLHDADKPPSEALRADLRVAPADTVRYRHVQLRCGALVLAEADNWYVPGRLTPDMNRLLETTDTPFGKVAQSLNFQRHTLQAELLWEPLPPGWEMGAAAAGAGDALRAPDHVLQHRALLTLPDGTPISEVVETYSGNVLAFPPPDSGRR